MQEMFARKRSRLPAQDKVAAAAHALLDIIEGRTDEIGAGRRLREEVGLQWSFITCLQYLSGQESLACIQALPDSWCELGRTKRHLQAAALLAAETVANHRHDGPMLCASHLARELKRTTAEQWLAERTEVKPEEIKQLAGDASSSPTKT